MRSIRSNCVSPTPDLFIFFPHIHLHTTFSSIFIIFNGLLSIEASFMGDPDTSNFSELPIP